MTAPPQPTPAPVDSTLIVKVGGVDATENVTRIDILTFEITPTPCPFCGRPQVDGCLVCSQLPIQYRREAFA